MAKEDQTKKDEEFKASSVDAMKVASAGSEKRQVQASADLAARLDRLDAGSKMVVMA